jgi:hypothetical protein
MVRKISLLLCAAVVTGLAGNASALYVNDTQTWGATRIENLDGGGLEVGPQGNLTITGRVDMDSGAWLRMSGGILNTTDTFKFPDSSGDQNVRMYIDAGTFTALDIENRGYERNGVIFVGGGTLIVQTNYLSGNREYDPQQWLQDNTLRPDAGYDQIVFTDLGGGAVKITTTAPTPEIAFDSAASGDLETVTPALLTVVLKNPEEGQTYTVDYAAVAGTATAGEDYYMAGGGPACWNYLTQCHGDCDNDANVKGSDFLALKNSWYACDPDANYNPCADFDRDGCVKGSDFLILKANWYQTVEANCPASGDNTLVFSPGETSKTIEIDIVEDGLHEEDETIILELSNPTGADAVLGTVSQHTYTIIDLRPKISFAAESGSGTEGATPALVAVSLSHTCEELITVDYAVTGGSATGGGVDYNLPAGTLTFEPAETIKNISIDIVDDDEQESTETIEISLSNPTNATLGQPAVHTYAILDNEEGTVFDGMVWYFSGDNPEGRFEVNAAGQLEWRNLKPPDHIIVRLPDQRLSDPGDVAEVSYWYKGEGCDDMVSGDRGTGDIRTGLFDSNGQGHVTWDGAGYRSETWCGYLGYRIGFSAHASGYGGHIAKRIDPFGDPPGDDVCMSLLQKAEGSYGPNSGQKDINAFGLPRGEWALWTLRLERTSSSRVVFTVMCNGRTAELVDNNPEHQPQKIDALGMYFANVRSYSLVTLATEQPTP